MGGNRKVTLHSLTTFLKTLGQGPQDHSVLEKELIAKSDDLHSILGSHMVERTVSSLTSTCML